MRENYDEYLNQVNEFLSDYIPTVDQRARTVFDAMKYSLTAGGKRLRPVLLLASCEFAGGDSRAALPYACAIEFIHTYSLIHDDLPAMDDDDLRRGKPTNHKVYGDAMAILAGDGLLNSAFEIMTKDMMMYFGDTDNLSKRINAMYAIAKGAGVQGMVAGQVADMESERKGEGDNNLLNFIHHNKTAALIVAAIRAGLFIGGANSAMLLKMSDYGENLGMAFQIADDILDVKGDSLILGKNVGMDREHNKLTSVSLNGLEEAENLLTYHTNAAIEAIADYYDNAIFFKDLVTRLAVRNA